MLVVHANWSAAALHLWAESLDGYVAMLETRAAGAGPERLDERGPDAAAAESAAAHPFALTGEELAACFAARPDCDLVNGHRAAAGGSVHLRLPTARARPLASDRLAGVIAAEEESPDAHLGVFRVPSLAIAGGDAIGVLLALEDAGPTSDIEFSHGLRYWMAVARFVLELLLDQRFVPTLFQTRHAELRAAWQPWLHDESARARVGALLAAMPPVVRAVVDDHQGRPWAILDDALCTLTDASVRRALIDDDFGAAIDGRDGATDPHVAWLAGLLAGDDRVDAGGDGASEMLRDVGCWIASLDERSEDRPLRLCFRLGEPDAADLPDAHTAAEEDVRWRLGLRLLGLGDDPPIIDAEQVWRDPVSVQVAAGGGVRNP